MITQLSIAEAQAEAANKVRTAWEQFMQKLQPKGAQPPQNGGSQPQPQGGLK